MEDIANGCVVRAPSALSRDNSATTCRSTSDIGNTAGITLSLDSVAPNLGKRAPSLDLGGISRKRQKGNESSTQQSTTPQDVAIAAPRTPSSAKKLYDRFIPNRNYQDMDYNFHQLCRGTSFETTEAETKVTPSQRKLNEELNLLKSGEKKRRLVDCRATVGSSLESVTNLTSTESFENRRTTPSKKIIRYISTAPAKILDAPDLLNDYYLNLLHWGSNNVLSIALGNNLFCWHPEGGQTENVLSFDNSNDYISSVQWSRDSRLLAVGTSFNTCQLLDATTNQCIRELQGHSARVSSLSWQNNDILSTGSKDSMIISHDHRMHRSAFAFYEGHTQEVCGLSWNATGTTLASGGNDNLLMLWDAAMNNNSSSSSSSSSSARSAMTQTSQSYTPRLIFEHHTAAVKAVAWCPWLSNTLASGGGTADRTIRIWNTQDGSNIKSVDTGSQVCAIQWSDGDDGHTCKELVSSHGFSDNQLIVWKYKDMSKIAELRGHTARVLHMTKSPCGTTICSASADETLHFWNVFEKTSRRGAGSVNGEKSPFMMTPSRKGLKPRVAMLSSPHQIR